MYTAIAAQARTDTIRSGLLWPALFVLILASILAIWIGLETHSQAHDAQQAALAKDAQNWNNQGARNPHSAAHFSRYVARPDGPLASLDPGLTPFFGTAVWMEAHVQRPVEYRPAEDQFAIAPLGSFSLGWVLIYLVPLLLIMLCGPDLAREREAGTWRTLRAAGAAPMDLLLGKLVGRASILLSALAILLILGVAVARSSGGLFPDDGTRSVLWVIGALGYSVTWALIALGVSAWAGSVRLALTILISLWALMVIAVPRIGASVSALTVEGPTQTQFLEDTRADVFKAIMADRAENVMPNTPMTLGADGQEVAVRGLRLQRGEVVGDLVYDERYGGLFGGYAAQSGLWRLAGLFSPAIAANGLMTGAAGTDTAHHVDFARQAENGRRAFIKYLNEDEIYNSGGRGSAYLAGEDLWANAPDVRYTAPALFQLSGARPATDFVSLLLWVVVAGSFALLGIRRRLKLG